MKLFKGKTSILLIATVIVCLIPVTDSAAATQLRELVKPTWEFEYVEGFKDGLALVRKDEKYGFVDKTGKMVVPLKYDYAEDFSEGMAVVSVGTKDNGYIMEGGKWGFIDKTGKEVIPLTYDNVRPFNEGFAAVRKDEKYGFINKKGEVTIPIIYDLANFFYAGMASVRKDEKEGVIDTSGNLRIPIIYDWVDNFSQKYDNVLASKDEKCGIINRSGEVIAPFEYDLINIFNDEGIATAKKGEMMGVIDRQGKVVIPFEYDSINFLRDFMNSFKGDMLAAQKGEMMGVIDRQGKVVIPFEYEYIDLYNNSGVIGPAMKNGKEVYVDRTGRIVPKPEADYSNLYYSEGLAAFEQNGKWGYVNESGKVVIPAKYEEASGFSSGVASVKKSGKWGYIDSSGNELNKFIYDVACSFHEDLAWVRIGTKLGLLQKYDGDGALKVSAVPTTQNVLVNGKKVDFDAYNIGGNNYFKIRDLAYALKDTNNKFEVSWDGAKNAINLLNGKKYTIAGGEMSKGTAGSKTATLTSSKIYLDGTEIKPTVYIINGSSYFKLADVGQVLGFGVVWDGVTKTVNINTTK